MHYKLNDIVRIIPEFIFLPNLAAYSMVFSAAKIWNDCKQNNRIRSENLEIYFGRLSGYQDESKCKHSKPEL